MADRPNSLGQYCINVADLDRSVEFWSEVIGIPVQSRTEIPTAKEVVLGTLRDAIAPNVPCTREDGSVNMVDLSGQACGTSPAWCWPFWCVGYPKSPRE